MKVVNGVRARQGKFVRSNSFAQYFKKEFEAMFNLAVRQGLSIEEYFNVSDRFLAKMDEHVSKLECAHNKDWITFKDGSRLCMDDSNYPKLDIHLHSSNCIRRKKETLAKEWAYRLNQEEVSLSWVEEIKKDILKQIQEKDRIVIVFKDGSKICSVDSGEDLPYYTICE